VIGLGTGLCKEDKMTIDTWLRIGAIGLPLVGALAIWRWGASFPRAQRQLAVFILGTIALIALALFLLNRYYACILAFGKGNCVFDGAATLFLFVLGILLARRCLVLSGANKVQDCAFTLLLVAALAGMGLAQNLCLFLVFVNLFLFSLAQWLKRKGIGGHFLMLRDDYADDEPDGV
jgi:hypothetical protein